MMSFQGCTHRSDRRADAGIHVTDTIVFAADSALEEVGAPYRIAVVNLDAREHERPEYLAVNPLA